jgi:hypothetical protein
MLDVSAKLYRQSLLIVNKKELISWDHDQDENQNLYMIL